MRRIDGEQRTMGGGGECPYRPSSPLTDQMRKLTVTVIFEVEEDSPQLKEMLDGFDNWKRELMEDMPEVKEVILRTEAAAEVAELPRRPG